MAARFEADGIAFRYPENWTLEREEHQTGWTVTLQSPETAFIAVVLFMDDDLYAATAADGSLETLRADYPDLESEPVVESIAGQPAVGHDAHFFSLDLTNTAGMRAFRAESGVVLLMWQLNDMELERYEPVLRAIRASIEEV